jgi:hypothetical protein
MPPDDDRNNQFDPIERAKQQQADEKAGTFTPGGSDESTDNSAAPVKNAEHEGTFANKTSGNPLNQKTKFNARTFFTKGRGSILTMLLLIGLGGGGVALFGGATAPIAFLSPIMNDLNDQLGALDIRNEASFRNKIPSTERDKALAGCTFLSIRCKFRTISTPQLERLNIAGIKVNPDTPNAAGRIKPDSYTFLGRDYSPQEFYEAINSRTAENDKIKKAFRRANNMKYIGVSDKSFLGKVLGKWNLTKKTELKGSKEDKLNQLMTRAGTDNPANVKFVPLEEGDPTQGYTLDGGDPDRIYNQAEVDKLTGVVDGIKTVKAPPSRVSSGIVKGLSVLGAADLACTIKNMLGAASVVAKVQNSAELAQYAMPVMSLTSQLQAGDLSPEDAEVLGEFLTQTDSRAKINDLQNSFNSGSPVAGALGVDEELATKDNPNYGKNAMDNSLYQMSVNGGVASTSSESNHYSLGVGQNMVLAGIAGAAEIATTIVNLGGQNNEVCKVVQNWAVRIGGMIAGLVIGIGSAGTSIAVQAAIFGGMMVASIALEAMINGALSGTIIDEGMVDAPVERGIATWTGASVILSESARLRGMVPGNAEQILAYNKHTTESNNEYIALEQEDANPLDASNPQSFLGSFMSKMSSFAKPLSSGASFLQNTSSLLSGSLSSLLQPATTMALEDDPSRFEQCDDAGYAKLGIDADVQCNIRYVMSDKDLAMDMDEVALFMENSGYVAKNTTTGLPVGYRSPDAEESQGFALDMLNGVTNSFFNTRGADPNYNDYAKYLDYCVYRAMPWGETYVEEGAAFAVGSEWQTGSKCLEDSTMMSNFRVYTFDKTVQEGLDEEPVDGSGGSGISGEISSPVSPGTTISDRFGPREAPCGGCSTWHQGVDFFGGDQAVFAVMDGIVLSQGTGQNNVVTIQHQDGLLTTYWHMSPSKVLVKTGDTVTAGQRIGTMGDQGQSTGVHLHIEMDISKVADRSIYESYTISTGGYNPGQRVDILDFLAKNGVPAV